MKKLMGILLSVLIAAMVELPVFADIAVTEPVEKSYVPYLVVGIVIIAAAVLLFAIWRRKK